MRDLSTHMPVLLRSPKFFWSLMVGNPKNAYRVNGKDYALSTTRLLTSVK